VTAPRWTEPGPTPTRLDPVRLSVDPDRVEDLVRKLRGVVDEVLGLERGMAPYLVVSPGSDAVSVNAAEQSNLMLDRARLYLAEWRRQLLITAEALERQLEAYLEADRSARA
jgi:hypothetical protein